MTTLAILVKRNVKLFFKDKAMFFTALITPGILLALYATFLGNVYKDSFIASLPGVPVPDKIINGLVAGQLTSSILAVSCVTVAFCANFLMVQDKVNGSAKDLLISPVKISTLSLAYYVATFLSTLIICLVSLGACLVYMAVAGWYMSFADVIMLFLDVVLLVSFGTALSSIINFFLSTQGQLSAVGTIISSGYGFICGAYMPLSSFGAWLQKAVMFLPGTYGTSLMRNHTLSGVIDELRASGVPEDSVNSIKGALDLNLDFFGVVGMPVPL